MTNIATKITKFKPSEWFDLETGTVWYGIKALDPETGEWYNVSQDGVPLIYLDKDKRDHRLDCFRYPHKGTTQE